MADHDRRHQPWNFEKFLVGRDGTKEQRFSPTVTPEDSALRAAIANAMD